MIEFDEDKQNRKVRELHQSEEEDLAQMLSAKYNISYIDLSRVPINTDSLRLIPEAEAREHNVAAFNNVGKKIDIAVLAPESEGVVLSINSLKEKGYIPTLYMTSTQSLKKAWDRYKDLSFAYETKTGSLDISSEEIEKFLSEVRSVEDIKKLITEALAAKKSYRVSKILVIIMAGAMSTKASDIHFEPEETYTRIRYRLDGVLIDILTFDNETYNLLLSRIKLLSNLKLNIKENAQDGRFSVSVYNDDIEIRTSVIPGAYGESIVLRLLNPKSISVPIEELGIEPRLYKILEHEIGRPDGMILTTGPTGSGKTTTLYSFLRKIHNPQIKIITIEDPIEYHLPGIVQTQVEEKKGYTFANGLRSALRQDPDVIMVGEIRDNETAETAINSSLTGHLVFSTLHTNNAAGAFPRLIDLGVNPKILTSAIHVSIAQRLVRKICQDCKIQIPVPDDKKVLVKTIIDSIPYDEYKLPPDIMWTGKGCDKCNFTGFKGRIGIYEAILTDQAVEAIVRENPSEREIKEAAKPQGILDMQQDGIVKVLKGVTSLEELERVVDVNIVQ